MNEHANDDEDEDDNGYVNEEEDDQTREDRSSETQLLRSARKHRHLDERDESSDE